MRVLVLFAHPGQRHSEVNTSLFQRASKVEGITTVDLYALYPRFKIDIDVEQERLVQHDAIILQFPLFWYSTPALLKEWQDLVLEYGFAYGAGGTALRGKLFAPVVTAGGPEDAYRKGGKNNFTLRTLLSPLEQTANLCHMIYVPPFVLYAALGARADGRDAVHADQYETYLSALRDNRMDIGRARERLHLTDDHLPLLAEA